MIDLIEYLLSSSGLTITLVLSSLFLPLREFLKARISWAGQLIDCPMCMGFWVGFVSSLTYFHRDPLVGGLMTSLFAWTIANLVDSIQSVGTYFENALGAEENE
jgi:hypothetical protein